MTYEKSIMNGDFDGYQDVNTHALSSFFGVKRAGTIHEPYFP